MDLGGSIQFQKIGGKFDLNSKIKWGTCKVQTTLNRTKIMQNSGSDAFKFNIAVGMPSQDLAARKWWNGRIAYILIIKDNKVWIATLTYYPIFYFTTTLRNYKHLHRYMLYIFSDINDH